MNSHRGDNLLTATQGVAAEIETVGGETGWRLERRLDNYHDMVLLADSLNQHQELSGPSRDSPMKMINQDSQEMESIIEEQNH